MPWCSYCGMTKTAMLSGEEIGVTWARYDGACCNPDGPAPAKAQRYVDVGDVVAMEIPYSEVCMSMQVAGKYMLVRLQRPYEYVNAQLLYPDGREFSAPITPGEAGFYFENGRYYCYAAEVAHV
jgi:hypothetical protein